MNDRTQRTHNSDASVGLGVVLVMLGGLFLINQVVDVELGRYLWPLYIVVPGLLFFVGMLVGGRSAAPLAIPGSIITTVGTIFLYQNTFNHFESWAYAWALVPSAAGVGVMIQGTWSGQPTTVRDGQRITLIGLTMFAIGFLFFELILNISGFGGGVVGPLILIAGGVLLLLQRLVLRRQSVDGIDETPALQARQAEPPAPSAAALPTLDATLPAEHETMRLDG